MSQQPVPVEPIGYYRATKHPLVRAVTFLCWFGIIFGLTGLALPILQLLQISGAPTRYLPSSYNWEPDIFEAFRYIHGSSLLILIAASAIALFGFRAGRRILIFYAYFALILFGVSQGVASLWVTWTSRSNPTQNWMQWLVIFFLPALHGLIFPVLVLVIFRDPSIRRYFEEKKQLR